MCITFRFRSMIENVSLGDMLRDIFLHWMHSGHPLWFPSESRGIVSVKMERGGPRAGDEGLNKPIDLYEFVGGEVLKFPTLQIISLNYPICHEVIPNHSSFIPFHPLFQRKKVHLCVQDPNQKHKRQQFFGTR
jgi:hypothetical protein